MEHNDSVLQLAERYFPIDSDRDILEEQHFGIVNGTITTNVLKSNALAFRTLYAPPFASSDFLLDVRLFGERIKASKYTWHPDHVVRHGRARGVDVQSDLVLLDGKRAVVMQVKLTNTTAESVQVPVRMEILGGMDYVTAWEFHRPKADKPARPVVEPNVILRVNDTGAYAVGCTLGDMQFDLHALQWHGVVNVPAGRSQQFHIIVAIGDRKETHALAKALVADPASALAESRRSWNARVADMLSQLPRFRSSNARLEQFYYRSALHLLLNQMHVPEFAQPVTYTTGSVNGGCICAYLWDYAAGWKIFPLYQPAVHREHVKAFLSIDLTRHFAINPMNGAGWGPWYPINQEKIIHMVYHYVLLTGDTAFLNETVRGKRVIDWMKFHALYGDEGTPEGNLLDYGGGNHHLELRREFRYDYILPDLNARRYLNYLYADALCELANEPHDDFRHRAELVKQLVNDELWSEADKWWVFRYPNGKRELRYTMQLFKLLGSGSITAAQQDALVARLNEDEFLSEFGLHSMAKHDDAYDQVDIDNGGGGACACFTPQIVERLYLAGYPDQAYDMLQRILWWGDRLPYWSDSLVANMMDYRKDTPLQNAIGSVCGAEAIIFGMFGVVADADGSITIQPSLPPGEAFIRLEGLVVRGRTVDIDVRQDGYTVTIDGVSQQAKTGQPIRLPAEPLVAH